MAQIEDISPVSNNIINYFDETYAGLHKQFIKFNEWFIIDSLKCLVQPGISIFSGSLRTHDNVIYTYIHHNTISTDGNITLNL